LLAPELGKQCARGLIVWLMSQGSRDFSFSATAQTDTLIQLGQHYPEGRIVWLHRHGRLQF
jgi:hypothetical protein